jgi:acetyltransferase
VGSLRYPSEWRRSGLTHDGASYEIRPVQPSDLALERAFIEALHEEPRYGRLLTRVDYESTMAFIAVVNEFGVERVVAAARYAATDQPNACEFAVTVASDWQWRGVSAVLTQLLFEYARLQGFRRICGTLRAAAERIIDLAHYLGLETRQLPGTTGWIEGWRSL